MVAFAHSFARFEHSFFKCTKGSPPHTQTLWFIVEVKSLGVLKEWASNLVKTLVTAIIFAIVFPNGTETIGKRQKASWVWWEAQALHLTIATRKTGNTVIK